MSNKKEHLHIVYNTSIPKNSSDNIDDGDTNSAPDINNGKTSYLDEIERLQIMISLLESRLKIEEARISTLERMVSDHERDLEDVESDMQTILELMTEITDMVEVGPINEYFIKNKLLELVDKVRTSFYLQQTAILQPAVE